MNTYDPRYHSTCTEVTVPAAEAFAYLSDPLKVGRWALGCFEARPTREPGLFKGRSLFDGASAWFRVDIDQDRNIIDYHVGDADQQLPRISIRIVPGPHYGRDNNHCIITMSAWRTVEMDDNRWQRLCATHEAEILMIQAHLTISSKK